MNELILELFSEEIPAKIQTQLINRLDFFTKKFFAKAGFKGDFNIYITPRRLTILATDFLYNQNLQSKIIKGPRFGANEKALQGFLQKFQLNDVNELIVKNIGKEQYYFYEVKSDKQDLCQELTLVINKIIPEIAKLWPKTMRWNSSNARWIRPLRNILCIYNKQILEVNYAGLKANNLTYGHRFLSDGSAFKITNITTYKKKLSEAKVMLEQGNRQKYILDEINNLCKKHKLTLNQDQSLLDEVSGLVEFPVILIGEIALEFMSLPEEVLITTLKNHQKYFCTRDEGGKLAPYFIFVSNNDSVNNKIITYGNERVLKARLADASFFYGEDLKKNLSNRFTDLAKIIFHKDIGDLKQQSELNAILAKYISLWVDNSHPVDIEVAARLAKVDLTTEMVGEFPELQGIIGSYYAKEEKLSKTIVNAIKDHYKPRYANDKCPVESTAICLALADRINNLVALTLIGEQPNGSKDPHGLRRSAIAIVRIILESKIKLPLKLIIDKSISNYSFLYKKAQIIYPQIESKKIKEHFREELIIFIFDKLRNILKEQNIKHDIINSVFNNYAIDDINKVNNLSLTLSANLKTEAGQKLLSVYNRAEAIYLKAEHEDGVSYNKRLHGLMWKEASEKELFSACKNIKSSLSNMLKSDDYEAAFIKLTEFIEPVEQFFANLMVNHADKTIRQNRLKLLATMCKTVNNLANFSKIEKSDNITN